MTKTAATDPPANTFLDCVDALLPGIVDNPWMGGHFPWPKQAHFIERTLTKALEMVPEHEEDPDDEQAIAESVYEALFGGAAGGGKSDACLMIAAHMAHAYPGSASVIIRRTAAELDKPGALQRRARQWWTSAQGIEFNASNRLFLFPNGSMVQMGYHHHQDHDNQYQGGEYQLVIFDELTHWQAADAWMHLRSRMRRPEGSGWPLRLLGTSNPGGRGHTWVKARFVGGVDIATGQRMEPEHDYYPSKIDDNPSLDRRSYEANLMHLLPTRREQLMDGSWDAREPGDYFRPEWFGPLLDPQTDRWPAEHCNRVRSWDLAATDEHSPNAATASRTAGVLMARHRLGCRVIEHCTSFQKVTGARDNEIVRQAKLDGPLVVQHLEIEPGSGGISQVLNLEARLKAEAGCRVSYARPKADQTTREAKVLAANPEHARGKTGRAAPVSACVYQGHVRRGECPDTGDDFWDTERDKTHADQTDGIRIMAGPWVQSFLDRLEGFPNVGEGNSQKIIDADEVDAMVGAWKYLEAHPPGSAIPPDIPPREPEYATRYGDDDDADDERDSALGIDWRGRYTP